MVIDHRQGKIEGNLKIFCYPHKCMKSKPKKAVALLWVDDEGEQVEYIWHSTEPWIVERAEALKSRLDLWAEWDAKHSPVKPRRWRQFRVLEGGKEED